MKDELMSIKYFITSSIYKCTSLEKYLSQFYEILPKIGDDKELCLIASIKCEHILDQELTVLAKSSKVLAVQNESKHNVKIDK
ncbi:hypothetical protein DPMN_183482 [Dreissena polymorpha]|uniref:Uncharacterized protein n=1 Tax=Dreissena polymorpha TaxID=45954 RepID=A0A9D4DHH9_DREPO|nr:hypothetical protein DPMN_183482 [Dreissena polymorpha]